MRPLGIFAPLSLSGKNLIIISLCNFAALRLRGKNDKNFGK
jgi:hypothetical protein